MRYLDLIATAPVQLAHLSAGLVAFESVIHKLQRAGHKIIFAGLAERPRELLARAGIVRDPGRIAFAPDLDTALSMALVHGMRIGALAAEPAPAEPAPTEPAQTDQASS